MSDDDYTPELAPLDAYGGELDHDPPAPATNGHHTGESDWHRTWKSTIAGLLNGRVEVTIPGGHRADVVAGRLVVELQNGYLPGGTITDRERFYGRMAWIYSARLFANRIHFGPRGIWIKQGPRCLAEHRRPVFVSNYAGTRFLELRGLEVVETIKDRIPDGEGGWFVYYGPHRLLGRAERLDLDRLVARLSTIAEPT